MRNRFRLTLFHSLPFLAIPPTCDYFKREHYVNSFGDDRRALNKSVSVVDSILKEKKSHVTLEHVMRFIFHLSLDKPIEKP